MSYVEKLFQCALKVLKEDLERDSGQPKVIREVFISNNQLAQVFGPDYRKDALGSILMQLMSWRTVTERYGDTYCSYTNLCPAFRYTKDGVVIHMYPQAIKYLDKR